MCKMFGADSFLVPILRNKKPIIYPPKQQPISPLSSSDLCDLLLFFFLSQKREYVFKYESQIISP